MYRSLLTAIMVIVLAVTNFTPVLANDAKPTYTAQDYVAFLTKRGESEPEALKVRDQFLQLSKEKQLKFVRYVSDPKIMAQVLSTPVPENSSVRLYNGDIVIENKTTVKIVESLEPEKERDSGLFSFVSNLCVSPCHAGSPVKTIRLTDNHTLKVVGIPSSVYTVWVLYTAQGNTVKAVKDGDGYVSNWWPVSLHKESVHKYIHGNKAQTCVIWSATFPVTRVIGLDCFKGTIHHDVIGDSRGKKSYRFY